MKTFRIQYRYYTWDNLRACYSARTYKDSTVEGAVSQFKRDILPTSSEIIKIWELVEC